MERHNVQTSSEIFPMKIQRGLMAFMREVDGEFEIVDKMGMVAFILEHADSIRRF
jgi:hypothetical protein